MSDRGDEPISVADVLRELNARVVRLVDLLEAVAEAGVSLDDSRMSYVEVQIDRPTWEAIKEAVNR